MSIKLAINGYGRIGRQILRAIYDYNLTHQFEVVGVNASGVLPRATTRIGEDGR